MPEEPNGEQENNSFDIGVKSLSESDWKNLLKQIKKGTCIPFVGPEICEAVYSKAQVAQKWADEESYPFEDRSDLARVSQFLAVTGSQSYPVDKLIEEFDGFKLPPGSEPSEPHRILADLPLPIYITTNYDNFMRTTLRERIAIPRDARTDFCRWRKPPRSSGTGGEEDDEVGEEMTPASPLVFHLFGHTEDSDSLVLTEYDYLKFLVNVSKAEGAIPVTIRGKIAAGSLLFLGYQFDDWDFRILIHTIANYLDNSLSKAHVSVVTPHAQQEAAIYLKLYFRNLDLRIYRGTSQHFLNELRNRWEQFSNG